MKTMPVAIIGAGPYGLSVAAHLTTRGIPFRIFGRPMESWLRNMPKGMFLKSEGFASNLAHPNPGFTLADYCARRGSAYADSNLPVSLETFRGYGLWFQQTAVPIVEDIDVTGVAHGTRGFALSLGSGETVEAERVIVATGLRHFAHVPADLRKLPVHLVSHSYNHRSFEKLTGQKVAVVGGGQSGLETAALLHEHGAFPQLIVRKSGVNWNPAPEPVTRGAWTGFPTPISPLGQGWKLWVYSKAMPAFRLLPEQKRVQLFRDSLGPAGAWWLRDRVENGVPLVLGHRLVSAHADGDGVRLALASAGPNSELHVHHVIAATGYRVSVDRLDFLVPDLRARVELVGGAPRLSAFFESSVGGLYFIGLPAGHTFGPAMRFVFGSRHPSPAAKR
jgi:hypothetical protein